MEKIYYDLTSSQNSIWLTEEFMSKTSMNIIGGYFLVDDVVDFKALNLALNIYRQTNDAIQLRFCSINGVPKQYLSEYVFKQFPIINFHSQKDLDEHINAFVKVPFTLTDTELFDCVLYKLPNGHGGFYAKFHHLISDAWTMGLFISEIAKYYSDIINKRELNYTPYPSYIDYIKSEKEYFDSKKFTKDKKFWEDIFDEEPIISHISNKYTVNNLNTKGRRISFTLNSELNNTIIEFCKSNNCSIYTFFMAIYSIYLAKINNNRSPIIGTPVLNRSGFKEKHTSGMFISTVPFKSDFLPNDTFIDYLNKIAITQLSIFRHQKYPYDILLKDIKEQYNLNENLYDLVLSYQNARDDKKDSEIDYISTWEFTGHVSSALEVHFYDMDNTGVLKIYYDYQLSQFSEDDINFLHKRILEIIDTVLSNPNIEIKDVSVITKNEQDSFLNNFNYTPYEVDSKLDVTELFKKQVLAHTNDTAVIVEDQKLTYDELNNRANIIANKLLDKGIKSNEVVGIMLNRSFNLLSSIWGVLKTGAAYLLIDPALPEERIQYMLSNAKSNLLITTSTMNIDFTNKLFIDEFNFNYKEKEVCINVDNESLFCVIYTSGSTGLPKGVALKRSGVINMLNSYKKLLYTDTCQNFLSTSTVAFDMFIVENFVSILSGKTVILANEDEQKVPIFTSKLIENYDVDFILSTPSKLDLLLSDRQTAKCLENVKVIQLGGEVFKPSLYTKLSTYTKAKIFNGYGPSECTACTTNTQITSDINITIGKPFLNTRIYILNDDLNILPMGYNGEMYIAGKSVGKGYINNEELTKKSFINDIFSGGIMYKTGDLARYDSSGNLVYLGRRDSQIKLHGLRIELEEITNKILKINNITNAVSIIKQVNNIDCICSYVVTSSDVSKETILEVLKKELPYYMVPSHIVFLSELPITINGKINLRALPEIDIKETKYIAPVSNTEKILEKIWKELLNIEKVSINSSFFDLGGDSLCSIKLVSEVYTNFKTKINIKDIFNYPTIRELGKYIDSNIANVSNEEIINKAPVSSSYPLSSSQKRIYVTVNMEPNSTSYNTPGAIVFDKCPDVEKLKEVINTLLNKHCSFKTFFTLENSDVVQKVVDKVDFNLDVIKNEKKDFEKLFEEFVKPFDLSTPPLFRGKLYIFDDNSSALLVDMHHIICDGHSVSIFINEFCKLYNNSQIEDNTNLDYIDYAVWENNNIKSEKYSLDKKYWVNQFKDELPTLNMPTTYSRPGIQSFEGSKINKTVSINNKIEEFCKKNSVTPFMFLLSAYYILLYKYTNQNDIIVGSPIIGRKNKSLYNIIGMFVNTLALRAKIDSKSSFEDFLRIISLNCFNAFDHQTYPFDELVKSLDIPRDVSRNPLFDTMLTYQNNENVEINLDGVKSSHMAYDNHTSKFDFSIEFIPNDNDLNITLEYCTKLFSKEFMEVFLEHYVNILDIVMYNPKILISEILMLTEKEKKTILIDFNNNTLKYPSNKSIIELFMEKVSEYPENIALIFKDKHLTYKELNEKSDKLAGYLQSLGVKKGDIVPTLLNRSIDLIVSILAILKCGAIYLPISILLPNERIDYILNSSNAKLIITSKPINKKDFQKINIINIEDIQLDINVNVLDIIKTDPDDVIYTIYTSGSTGNPKGVQVTNKNLNNFIHSFNNLYKNKVNYKDICLSSTNISFDVSIWEFFFTLLNGATLYLYPHENIDDLIDYCKTMIENKITMAYIPPNILQEVYSIIQNEKLALTKILIGVEPIKNEVMQQYFKLNPQIQIINGYGPTETTICCTAFEVEKDNDEYSTIPIGKPLHNLSAYVLDADLQPTPIGVYGTLYIVGDNVSKGYLNSSDLTKKSYMPCIFNKSKIMYNTGDIVKWLPNGNLIFSGRNDDQLKIKGHRIEINEIINAILQYPTINKCQVIVKEHNNNKYLVAFFTANKKIITNDLRMFLGLKLPFYNIPNIMIQLDQFKLTANGKIDFKYLKNYTITFGTKYEAPRNDLEKHLVSLWKQYLGIEKIGITDNFFELGGDSLIAIELQIEIFKLGYNISYSDIFTHPTIKELSAKANTKETEKLALDKYNYSTINKKISKNALPISTSEIHEAKSGNILLTGVTGFVGIHILDKLITDTNSTIYCLIRKKNNMDILKRLVQTLHFYFGNKYDNEIDKRIKVIEGNIAEDRFSLSLNQYNELGKNISYVINSAAIVKHYGNQNLFDQTNIKGVQNIIDFCKDFKVKLYHISTLSVSGNVFAEDSYTTTDLEHKTVFKENNLFVKQNLSNIYIHTKFVAERLILENINNDFKATIIRLGNITSRYSDGKFQINVSENAFVNRLVSFMKLQSIPDYLSEGYLEFTPVDICAEAIVKIMGHDFPYTIFHLYNNNHVVMNKMISYLKDYGININIVNNEKFIELVNASLKNDKSMLSGIINDFDSNKKLIYESNIELNNEFTNEFLKKIGFVWPEINEDYIFKYFDYLKNINYI